jgi:hypothetical protein
VIGIAVAALAAVVFAGDDVSDGGRAFAGALGAGVTTLAVLIGCFSFHLLRAPIRQRNEAWEALGEPEAVVPEAFSDEFARFVEVAESTRPRRGFDLMGRFNMSRADRAREDSENRRADDQARRDALAQYHDQFRDRFLRLIDSDSVPEAFRNTHRARASAPKHFSDLFTLDYALQRLVKGEAVVLQECIDEGESLIVAIGDPHIANSYVDFERWHEETASVLEEISASWREEFAVGDSDSTAQDRSEDALRVLITGDLQLLRGYLAGTDRHT